MKQDKTCRGWRKESKATGSTVMKKLPPGWNARRNPAGKREFWPAQQEVQFRQFTVSADQSDRG